MKCESHRSKERNYKEKVRKYTKKQYYARNEENKET